MNSCALGSVGFTDFERRRRSAHRLPKILFRTCRPPMRQDQHRCRHSNVASCILYVACSGFPRRMCCCTQHGSHGAGRDNVHAELATTAEPCRQSHPRVLALVRIREHCSGPNSLQSARPRCLSLSSATAEWPASPTVRAHRWLQLRTALSDGTDGLCIDHRRNVIRALWSAAAASGRQYHE